MPLLPEKHHLNSGNPVGWIFILLIWMFIAGYGCNIFEEGEGTYQLTANPLPATAGQVVISGTDPVEVHASPHENWSFSHWSGDMDSLENPLQISLTQNMRIFANFELSGNQNQVALRVSDGQFLTDLQFGRLNGATDGFDSTADLEAPPPPPDGVLYAWFETDGKRLLRDFRNPLTLSQEWNLTIVPGESSVIDLVWDMETGVYTGTWTLRNSDSSFQIDLPSVNHTTLHLTGTEVYTLTYIAAP